MRRGWSSPSNIHDNAYAVGTIDFTGDMPVILGPDGPSLGGFVCPVTIVEAELWKIGQLKAGDVVRFRALSLEQALELKRAVDACLDTLSGKLPVLPPQARAKINTKSPLRFERRACGGLPGRRRQVPAGEYGPNVLDLNLRFRVHALEQQYVR